MRTIPEVLGRWSARETFLLTVIRDLEARVDRAESVLRVTVPPSVCIGPVHVFKPTGDGCFCGHYPPSKKGTA